MGKRPIDYNVGDTIDKFLMNYIVKAYSASKIERVANKNKRKCEAAKRKIEKELEESNKRIEILERRLKKSKSEEYKLLGQRKELKKEVETLNKKVAFLHKNYRDIIDELRRDAEFASKESRK